MSEQISQSMHSENKKKKQKKKSDSKSAALMRNTFHLSFGEEVGNAVSHGVMMFLLLFADPLVCLYAYLQQGWLRFAGTMIYMLCMIIMFGGSCLYHIMPYDTEWKYVFRKLDHISILLAIAGTYTPICLCLVQGWLGWIVLALEWLLALAGILLKSISSKAFPKLSMTLYMCMGWLALPLIPQILSKGGLVFFLLILAGGICYTIGAFFFGSKKPYMHFVWHLWIIAAALCHMAAIVFFL
jgi:hemolysin III